MTHNRLATFGSAAAMFVAVTLALAGNGAATPATHNGPQIEQTGPKPWVGSTSNRPRPTTSTTRPIAVTLRALDVEELGPKYLLR